MNTIAKTTHLSHLIMNICTGDYKESELVDFVTQVQKISLSYLKYQEVIGKHIRWERTQSGGELEDLALDCVAGLFMRNEKNEFVQFQKYFCQNSIPVEQLDEEEVEILLRRLVIKKTKQELSRIFKERDPEGAKIVRNIKVAIKSSDDFESFREMGREYIYFKSDSATEASQNGDSVHQNMDDSVSNGVHAARRNGRSNGQPDVSYLRKSKPSIPETSLRGEYLSQYCPKDPTSAGMRKMLSVVKSDDRYQNFLPLDMIARIMRLTNLEMARERLVSQVAERSPLDDLKTNEIEKRKVKVLKQIQRKIESQYVASGKISAEKGRIYYRALADILEDISHGKKYDSYFKHLKRYVPNLSQRNYRNYERTIFEYLGKLIKKWFRDSLIELL
jgi:hypothetical protein